MGRMVPALVAAGVTLGALVWLPRVWTTNPSAAALGFDPGVAHLLLAVAALLCVLAYAAAARSSDPSRVDAPAPVNPSYGLALLVAGFVLAVYLPPALARYGPYLEDKYFLTAVLRALSGQSPYAEFEFLYGPLLIYGPTGWMERFGYTMQSYYWLLALAEAVTFALLAVWVSRRLQTTRERVLALVVLGLLLVNDNLGLSWIAARRLLPIAAIAVYAAGGPGLAARLAPGLLLGLSVLISLDFAAAGAAAILFAGAVEAFLRRTPAALVRASLVLGVAGVSAAGLGLLLMGGSTGDWLRATLDLIALRGGGEAAFPFAITVHAAAVFGLLFLACAWIGAGLPALRHRDLESGDRFLIAAVAYAIVAFKSGLARSDMYHLVPPVLGLVVLVLLPLPFAALGPRGGGQRKLAAGLVALMCVTYLPGLAGTGRLWAQGLALGTADLVAGVPADGTLADPVREVRLGPERTEQPAEWVELAEYLAAPERIDRPVLYYSGAWGLDRYIGAPTSPDVYPTDDYLVSDSVGLALRDYLARTPEAIVLARRIEWEWLNGGAAMPVRSMFWIFGRRSAGVRFLEHWSSVHFGTVVPDEAERKRQRWARTVGPLLRERFRPVGTIGEFVVLQRGEDG